ncbi:MAG TPA: RluA family pseudouridine synthase [Alphaproteobacteria bacterium]|nr:RluA family pseudouridine synthase [Alphaproteobacteria bacterium]
MSVETRTVAADEADTRLDRWFKRHYPQVTHGHLQKLLRTGQVRVEGKRAKADQRLEPGQTVRVPPIRPEDDRPEAAKARPAVSEREAKELLRRVLYKDDDVIVIDKPHGLAVQGGTGTTKHLDGMLDALAFDGERPKLVHRLDRDTSGVLVLARNVFAANALAKTFRGHEARKIYWAIVMGHPQPYQGRIDLALAKQAGPRGERVAEAGEEGQKAVTVYTTLEHIGRKAAWLALWPQTGRTHQLRVHCASALKCPILGDGKYGEGAAHADLLGSEIDNKLHLHARRIIMPHPRKGRIDVTAPPSPHFQATLDYLGLSLPGRERDPFEDYER